MIYKNLNRALWALAFVAIAVGFLGNALEFWEFRFFSLYTLYAFFMVVCLSTMIHFGSGFINTTLFAVFLFLFVSEFIDPLRDFTIWIILAIIFAAIGLKIIMPKTVHFKRRNHYLTGTAENYDYSGKLFDGAKINVRFSGVQIDLSNAQILNGSVLNINAKYSAVRVILPPNVALDNKMRNILSFKQVNRYGNPNSTITLRLRGRSMLGTIIIE